MRTSKRPAFPENVSLDTLPPVVLRKYFSSLERLRLEDGWHTSRTPSRLSAPTLTTHIATKVSDSILQTGDYFSSKRLSRTRCSTADLSPNTLEWFGSLSPAVQKKLFSREECFYYSQEQPTVILDAADETLRRRNWHSCPPSAIGRRSSEDDETCVNSEVSEHDKRVDSGVEMDTLDGLTWLNDEKDLDLRLDDYHQAIAETSRRTSFILEPVHTKSRRKGSISSLSLRPRRTSTSSARPRIDSAPTPTVPTIQPHSRTSSFSLKHLRSQASVSSIEPAATHYRDPTARMQLRLYLASPQNFDEALEFGFPSQGKERPMPVRPMTSPQTQSRPDANRTFFYDDTPDLSDDEDDDESLAPDRHFDPRTPEDPVFPPARNSPRKTSVDNFSRPRAFSTRRATEASIRQGVSEREMTLHMTLTRPDLRSPEENRPPTARIQHALSPSLEKFQFTTESRSTSIWDTLPPVKESRVKSFFRKFKLK